jgi:hypothetical protein
MSLDDFGFVGHRAGGSQFHAGAGPTPESEIRGYGLVGFGRYSKGPSLSTLPGFFFPRVHVTSVPHLHPDRGSINGRGFPGVEAIVNNGGSMISLSTAASSPKRSMSLHSSRVSDRPQRDRETAQLPDRLQP